MITTHQSIGKMITQSANVIIFVLSFFLVLVGCYHLCYHLMLSFFNRENDNTVRKCYHFCVIIYGIIFRVLSFMLSFDVIIFHGQQMLSFYVIIFPCTYFVLSFMLSFDVIIYCYPFPPFFFFLKTWHTPYFMKNSAEGVHILRKPISQHFWYAPNRLQFKKMYGLHIFCRSVCRYKEDGLRTGKVVLPE